LKWARFLGQLGYTLGISTLAAPTEPINAAWMLGYGVAV